MARREHDAYDTPPECALACARWCKGSLGAAPLLLGDSAPLNVLDPTAGGGPFVRAARATWPEAKIAALDIRPEVEPVLKEAGANWVGILDVFTIPPEQFAKVDLVLTNPPFALADELFRHLWPAMKDGASIVFLLPVTFWGSDDRWKIGDDPDPSTPDASDTRGLFTIAKPWATPVIVPRPSFLLLDGKETSPKFEAALFVWTKGKESQLAEPIRWTKPRKPRAKRKDATAFLREGDPEFGSEPAPEVYDP